MSSPADAADAEALALSELAELGMALARDAAARAQAAESNAEAAALGLAFERLARSVRLTFALRARLARQGRGERLDLAEARRKQIRSVIARTLTREDLRERERRDVLYDIDERLFEGALDGGLAEGPIEAAIARIRAAVGLPSSAHAPAAAPAGADGVANDGAPAQDLVPPTPVIGRPAPPLGVGGLPRPSG